MPVRALSSKNSLRRLGRSGGARTPSPRFWRPVLYQLSYTPRDNALKKDNASGAPSTGMTREVGYLAMAAGQRNGHSGFRSVNPIGGSSSVSRQRAVRNALAQGNEASAGRFRGRISNPYGRPEGCWRRDAPQRAPRIWRRGRHSPRRSGFQTAHSWNRRCSRPGSRSPAPSPARLLIVGVVPASARKRTSDRPAANRHWGCRSAAARQGQAASQQQAPASPIRPCCNRPDAAESPRGPLQGARSRPRARTARQRSGRIAPPHRIPPPADGAPTHGVARTGRASHGQRGRDAGWDRADSSG